LRIALSRASDCAGSATAAEPTRCSSARRAVDLLLDGVAFGGARADALGRGLDRGEGGLGALLFRLRLREVFRRFPLDRLQHRQLAAELVAFGRRAVRAP
jgi:hypothetical protein